MAWWHWLMIAISYVAVFALGLALGGGARWLVQTDPRAGCATCGRPWGDEEPSDSGLRRRPA